MSEPVEFYTEKKKETNKYIERLRKIARRQSLIRVVFFLLAISALYALVKPLPVVAGSLTVLFFALLIITAMRHQNTQRRIKRSKVLQSLINKELKALEGSFSGFSNGITHLDKTHPYANDLDIFGEGSLFQRMNRTFSEQGSKQLAHRLTNPKGDSDTIEKIQQGVQELSGKPQWMLNFRTTGEMMPGDIDERNLLAFFGESYKQYRKKTLSYILYLVPFLTLVMLGLTIAGTMSFSLFILYLLIVPGGISLKYINTNNHIHNKLGRQAKRLQLYSHLLGYLEKEDWNSREMRDLHQKSQTHGKEASAVIQQLTTILDRFDYRLHMIAGVLLNIFLLWDIRMVRSLEFWKEAHAPHVETWLSVLNEIEVLVSQAVFSHNHPEYIFPEPADDVLLQAVNAGHPFIPGKKRVGNPIDFTGWDEFMIITGGNMAGKSTYLRTVGINLVLAMTGSPVCADKFRFKPMTLITSIRSDDSLQENESLFYAELKKLRDIIQKLENGEKLFLLLDEILKGTNSADKQKGSLALLRQLLRYKTSGAIATHDLAVGNLADDFPDAIQNHCFEIEIQGENLHFDYKLRKGIARNLNASFLMRRMGITLEEE